MEPNKHKKEKYLGNQECFRGLRFFCLFSFSAYLTQFSFSPDLCKVSKQNIFYFLLIRKSYIVSLEGRVIMDGIQKA